MIYSAYTRAGYTIQVKDGHHRVLIHQPEIMDGIQEMILRYDGTLRGLAKWERENEWDVTATFWDDFGGEADGEGTGEDGEA